MRINIRIVRVSQFLHQFHLVVWHKLSKEHIILDALSRLANTNDTIYNNKYSKLKSLFAYYITIVEINSNLVKRILNGYMADN